MIDTEPLPMMAGRAGKFPQWASELSRHCELSWTVGEWARMGGAPGCRLVRGRRGDGPQAEEHSLTFPHTQWESSAG